MRIEKKILILSANPLMTNRLQTDDELAEVWRRLHYAHDFTLIFRTAVTFDDLRVLLLDETPHILHFSGHGKDSGLLLDDGHGDTRTLTPNMLLSVLEQINKLECIFLNACDSQTLGETIQARAAYIITMQGEISDAGAREFTKAFYDGLVRGRSYPDAFKLGKGALEHENAQENEAHIPTLISNPEIIPRYLDNPYLGLDFFRTEDQDRFFGRDAPTEELSRLVRQHRFVALIGASGSGKSSLLYAGLLPRLADDWTTVVFHPNNQPFAEFANAYLSAKYPDLIGEDRKLKSKKLTKQLENAELELKDLVELLLENRDTREVLLIADQFEELYTLNPPAEQRKLVAALTSLLDPALPCRVLLSYRADFTGEAIDSFGDLLNQHGKLFLERMSAEELREAIEKPAQQQGVSFEAELAARMIQDVGEEPGYLPLLQFALLRLWGEREGMLLTHRGYERIGGVQRALAGYADSVLARFTAEEQTRIRRIFMQLVRPGEVDTRQVATREQIADWPLVTALADVRLVVTGQRDGQETVEVAHEALIQHWQTLRDWINEDRLALRLLADVRHQAGEWDVAERAASHLPRWNAKLEQAEELLGNPRFGAAALELAFLRACRALKEKEEREEREKQRKLRIRLRWAVGVSILAALAAGLSFYFFLDAQEKEQTALSAEAQAKTQEQKALEEKQRADEQKNQALRTQSLFLADLSTQYSNKGFPATAMRLALEALPNTSQQHPQRPFVPQAQQALYDALATQRKGIVEHDGEVNKAVFSPDGKTILTASNDNTARLWPAFHDLPDLIR